MRYATVYRSSLGRPAEDEVRAYLPANYKVLKVTHEWVLIGGEDDHGWTLHEYVIPRLASGLISAREVSTEELALTGLTPEGGGGSDRQEAEG